MSPQRIQRKRTKGWKSPEGTVYVGRPTDYGNPFQVGASTTLYSPLEGHLWGTVMDAAHAAMLFEAFLIGRPDVLVEYRRRLAGRNLSCWCSEGSPCHGDVLLRMVNKGEPE